MCNKVKFLVSVIVFIVAMPTLALADNLDLVRSLNKLDLLQQGQQVKSVQCSPFDSPKSFCPVVLKSITQDDKENRFLGALKSRYESCKKIVAAKHVNASNLLDLFSKNSNELGTYTNNILRSCSGSFSLQPDEIAKFYYYAKRLNEGAGTLAKNQLSLARILGKTPAVCPNKDVLAVAAHSCEQQKKCQAGPSLTQIAKKVAEQESQYLKLTQEYKDKSKNCKTPECQDYLQKLGGVIHNLNIQNPWFLNNSFLDGVGKSTTEKRLKTYFESLYKAQDSLGKDIEKVSLCIHGRGECSIKNIRETIEKMPPLAALPRQGFIKTHLAENMDAQACIEEGALDRDRTSDILKSTSRDAVLTVSTMGLSSVPMLAKLGLSGRALATVRYGGVVSEFGVSTYYATAEWKNAAKSCGEKSIDKVSATTGKSCNSEYDQIFSQQSSNCYLDASLAVLATAPMGLQFVTAHRMLKADSLVQAGAQARGLSQELVKNAQLSNKDRIAAFEKLNRVPPGTYAKDPAKARAIVEAHNMSGTMGNLSYSQIRERVAHLKASGFTSAEIRVGLAKGIFGNLSAAPGSVQQTAQNLEKALAKDINAQLTGSRVVQSIRDTKGTAGGVFAGDNNAGIEILEQNGRKLFAKIKFPPDDRNLSEGQLKILEQNFINEVAYVKKLSDMNLGPKFHGVMKGEDGKLRIVTDFVDGFEVHLGDVEDVASKLSSSTIKEIGDKSSALIRSGIDPLDIQFRVGNDGKAHIIDPEYFGKLDAGDTASVLKDLRKDLDELRYYKDFSSRTPVTYTMSKNQSAVTVNFSKAEDLTMATSLGKIVNNGTLPKVTSTRPDIYNYVLTADGQMILGKVDNDWQLGVGFRNLLPQGKRIAGIGEMRVSKEGVEYNVSNLTAGGGKADTKSVETKVEQFLRENQQTKIQSVGREVVLAPTRKPSFGELASYCADKVFRQRNSNLCAQVAELTK